MNMTSKTRVALVGAGYIADWHAAALRACPHTELVAIVDLSKDRAEAFGVRFDIAAFPSLAQLAAEGAADAVHILTPPNSHSPLCDEALELGFDVLVEKPATLTSRALAKSLKLAETGGQRLSVGHNFLGLPGYERLKRAVNNGSLGRIGSAEFHWHLPLEPLRAGPFGLWMLQAPQNLLLELGPHLFAFATDLFGPVHILSVETGKIIELPGGARRPQSIRIAAQAGDVAINFALTLVETLDERRVVLRGSSGRGELDFARDALIIEKPNTLDIVANPLLNSLDLSTRHLIEGLRNFGRQVISLNRKSPYADSFLGMVRSVYGTGTGDRRFDPTAAISVMKAIEQANDLAGFEKDPVHRKPKTAPKPDVLVIGGTGFIGRALTRGLVAKGHHVRVLSRGKTGPFDDLKAEVEVFQAGLKDQAALCAAMEGIDCVFNLAKAHEETWEDCLSNDVDVATGIAQAALDAGVRRLIYTGTIASYDMSKSGVTITENTGFGDMEDRNLYARSKAECERQLSLMAREKGLALVIARPGIVVGRGGPLQHWGIGRWHGAGAIKVWGNGRHVLPFVWIDDVVDGLISMVSAEKIEGESFNLIGNPTHSARDYFEAIERHLGSRIHVSTGNMAMFFVVDRVKYLLKTKVLGRKNVPELSYRDWASRAHYAYLSNTKAKAMLDWSPLEDRASFEEKAITEANLFGF